MIEPGKFEVNIGKIVDDTLNLFPGDTIPVYAGPQMHVVVGQLSTLAGVIGAIQKSLGPAIGLARQGNMEPLENIYELLMGISTGRP